MLTDNRKAISLMAAVVKKMDSKHYPRTTVRIYAQGIFSVANRDERIMKGSLYCFLDMGSKRFSLMKTTLG